MKKSSVKVESITYYGIPEASNIEAFLDLLREALTRRIGQPVDIIIKRHNTRKVT